MGMMAEFYRSENRLSEAESFAEKARAIAVRSSGWADAQWAVQVLRKVAVQQHDYPRAYALAREELRIDSTQQASHTKELTENLRVRYETEQAEQKARIGQLQAAEQAGRARFYALVAGGLLLLVVGGGALIGLLVRSRRKLRASEAALRQAHNTQQELMRIIGHDLRGPVATFQQITPLLHDIIGPAPAADDTELVRELDTSAQYLGALLDNLLGWARVEGGLVNRNPVRLHAAAVVQSVVLLYEMVARHKGLALSYDVPADLTLIADVDLLTTVLRNLLANALKFTPAGGTVQVAVAAVPGGGTVFSVTDSGVGMSAETLAAVFDASQFTSRPGTAGEPGTGLGLPLCRRFVALLGGELHAAPNVGAGMRFWFQLA
jgi:signal transduction histidine kinase